MEMFDTAVLNRVVEDTAPIQTHFLDKYFGTVETSDTEAVMFDTVKGRRRITPFVSPRVQGKVIREDGFKTQSLVPAYLKDKRVFDPNKAFKRRAGEKIGGSLTPQARINAMISFALEDQLNMWKYRLEVMAAEVLRTGKALIVGEDYPEREVDFGRDPDHTIALAGNHRWNVAHVDNNPIEDIENWAQMVFDATGKTPTDLYLGKDAWKALKLKLMADEATKVMLDMTKRSIDEARMQFGPLAGVEGAKLVAVLGDFNIWVYAGKYIDPNDNTEKDIFPVGGFLFLSSSIEGVRHFGAIRDLKAGIQPRDYFVKSWEEEDPSVRYILGQSAPLIVPYRPDATCGGTVI